MEEDMKEIILKIVVKRSNTENETAKGDGEDGDVMMMTMMQ